MKTPGKNIFILGATCISILAIILVAKSRGERMLLAESKPGIFSATSSSITDIRDIITKNDTDSILATTTNPFAPSKDDTLTDSLSKNLFLSYIQYDSQDLLNTSEGIEQVASKVLANIDTKQLPTNTYTFNQIRTFSPKIRADLFEYGNAYATAEIGNLRVIKDKPEIYRDSLQNISKVYAKVAEDLMKIKTPLVLAPNHLAIANAYKIMSESLINIDKSATDPLKATLSIKIFKESLKTQSDNYLNIASFLQENGILFPENQPGSIFNKK